MHCKQLTIFEAQEKEEKAKIKAIEDLLKFVNDFKYFTLLLNLFEPKKKAFTIALDIMRDLMMVGAYSSKDLKGYEDWGVKKWMSVCEFNPIYTVLDERSPSDLYKIALDYRSRLNSRYIELKMAFRVVPNSRPSQYLTESSEKMEKIVTILKHF